jgi:hypothetical protein
MDELMQMTLDDIGDLFKALHAKTLEIERLKLQVQELEEALGRKKVMQNATSISPRSGDGGK